MIFLAEATIETSLLLLAALSLSMALRRRSAALRHWVLAAAFACAAIAPLLGTLMPRWQVPATLAPFAADLTALSVPAPGGAGNNQALGAEPQRKAAAPQTTSGVLGSRILLAVAAIWLLGAAAMLSTLIVGFARLSAAARSAARVADGPWAAQAAEIRQSYRLRTPLTLLQSRHPSLLVTWGLFRAVVILPAGAARWTNDRVGFVLAHELAHVRRRDWAVHLGAEALKCVHWFNPLVWVACAHLRDESERACDDAVLNRGADGGAYAKDLVEIARELRQRRLWAAAPAMVRASSLERRVRAMLDDRMNRHPVSRRASLGTLMLLAAITLPIAGFTAAQTFSSLTGSIVDPTNAVVPGATVALTNAQTQAKYEVRSDGSGRYEFVGLVPGEYLFETRLPGFATFKTSLIVGGQNVQRDLRLEVGSVSEEISITSSRTHGAPPPPPPPARPADFAAGMRAKAEESCAASTNTGDVRVGGNILPPRKLKDVRPWYPPALVTNGVEGTVILKGRIGTAGLVEDVVVVSAPHPDLGQSAADAVRQWEFIETFLNCTPVAVNLNVKVMYSLKP
jgi:TonB family protein